MMVWQRYRGSYMSAPVLLNLLNKLRKRDKMPFYLFFATSVRFYLSYDIKIYFEIIFLARICVTLKASFHNVSRKCVNH